MVPAAFVVACENDKHLSIPCREECLFDIFISICEGFLTNTEFYKAFVFQGIRDQVDRVLHKLGGLIAYHCPLLLLGRHCVGHAPASELFENGLRDSASWLEVGEEIIDGVQRQMREQRKNQFFVAKDSLIEHLERLEKSFTQIIRTMTLAASVIRSISPIAFKYFCFFACLVKSDSNFQSLS